MQVGYRVIAQNFSVQYEAADGELSAFVASFYRFEYEGNDLSELERADRAQFRFSLVGSGTYAFGDGKIVVPYPVTIIGPTTRPVTISANCPILTVGWGMQPAGWAGLMGKDAERWTDDALDAKSVFGEVIEAVRAELSTMSDWGEQLKLLKEVAQQIYGQLDQAPFEFTAAVDHWLMNDAKHDIYGLLAATKLSLRQLERMTKRCYGLPPRKLARKYRALRAAQMIAHGDSLDDHDIGLSFYDQSHLVREVKQFTGLTPKELEAGVAELTKATMQGRKQMQGKVNPLVSDS